MLARYQGKEYNDWRDEEPGKILHEYRQGEMTRCGEMPAYHGRRASQVVWMRAGCTAQQRKKRKYKIVRGGLRVVTAKP